MPSTSESIYSVRLTKSQMWKSPPLAAGESRLKPGLVSTARLSWPSFSAIVARISGEGTGGFFFFFLLFIFCVYYYTTSSSSICW